MSSRGGPEGTNPGNNRGDTSAVPSSSPSKDDFDRIARQARAFREAEAKRIASEKVASQQEAKRQKEAERQRITRQHGEFLKQQQGEILNLQRELEHLQKQQADGSRSRTAAGRVAERTARLQKQLQEAEARLMQETERLRPATPSQPPPAAATVSLETTEIPATTYAVEDDAMDSSSHRPSLDRQVETRHLPTRAKYPLERQKENRHLILPAKPVSEGDVQRAVASMDASLLRRDAEFELELKNVRRETMKQQVDQPPELVGDGVTDDDEGIDKAEDVVQVEERVQTRMSESDEDLAKEFEKVENELIKASSMLGISSETSSEIDREAVEEYVDLLARDLSFAEDQIRRSFSLNEKGLPTVAMEEGDSSQSQPRTQPAPRSPSKPLPQSDASITIQSYHGPVMSESTMPSAELTQEEEISESLDRTRAMMADDDFLPKARYNNVDARSTKDEATRKAKSRRSLMVYQTWGVHASRKGRRGHACDDDTDSPKEIMHKTSSFEVPIEITNEGFKLSPKIAELSMLLSIPPARLGGRWSGVLEGKSSFGSNSTATGSASLEYRSSKQSRLTVGTIRGCEANNPLITIGGRFMSKGSSVGITFYNHFTSLPQKTIENLMYSLTLRHSFPSTKWSLSSSLSRRQDLSLALTNGKLSGRVGFNPTKPGQLSLRLDARPKLSAFRRAHCYCQWRTGVWQFGISLVQSLHSEMSTIGLGWRLYSATGFEWVLSWSRGSASVRVPIVISKGLAAASFGQVLYFSLVSHLIQDCIAQLWAWIGTESSDDTLERGTETESIIPPTSMAKERNDAVIQRELMTRQARRKAKNETERAGLIIQQAVYRIKDGDEWDATVPVQFWVSNSSLALPGRPKSELLGFYDVATASKQKKAKSDRERQSKSRHSWTWRDVWKDLVGLPAKRAARQSKRPIPTLSVQYLYRGQSFCIVVEDSDELILPNPNAVKVE